jgi:hypothetical protein
MLMLQAYFDDSGSDVESQIFALAGFVCSVEGWKEFSSRWQATLNKEPRLAYFKMSEASALDGEFKRGWNPSLRNQRVFELADIISEYASARVDCAIMRAQFEYFRRGLRGGAWADPYFICFYYVITVCLEYLLSLDQEATCDFIFDEQGAIGYHAIGWWRIAKELAGNQLGRLMGSPPVFRDDKKIVPLQAADLYAWQLRHFLHSNIMQDQPQNYIAARLAPICHLTHLVTEDDLKSLREASIGALRGTSGQ